MTSRNKFRARGERLRDAARERPIAAGAIRVVYFS
jgi:hypothetical protein